MAPGTSFQLTSMLFSFAATVAETRAAAGPNVRVAAVPVVFVFRVSFIALTVTVTSLPE